MNLKIAIQPESGDPDWLASKGKIEVKKKVTPFLLNQAWSPLGAIGAELSRAAKEMGGILFDRKNGAEDA
ncbi:hypothetical protein KAJ83_01685 [Marivibrio halodurans]|uniref:Uncharacterized protein n=1 Tax=Marivibrio halodurans TaxID=2039722 RepID=A0A8J7RZ30_9PROT|nr:hypothetical protein [Marivibrio halodurans]MBP5855704.1 hypothetical protein [Marivibrio halodurans]